MPALAAERFGPGEVLIGTVGMVRTTANSHTAIHRVMLDEGELTTACSQRPRHIVTVAPSTGNDDVLAALERGGYEPCRLCRFCWPTVAIPEHDQFTCYTRHRLPGKVRNVLSRDAITLLTKLISLAVTTDHDIVADDRTWAEIRAAFPRTEEDTSP